MTSNAVAMFLLAELHKKEVGSAGIFFVVVFYAFNEIRLDDRIFHTVFSSPV
jgi:hypothetical protein